VAGTSGSHGLELGTSSANWHVSGKMWYSDGDGWRIAGARHTLNNVEAQDNDLAGFRLICNLLAISNWLADSNSYSGTKYTGWHSGLEVGLLPATSATAQGSASGGYNINIGTGRAWDKNEGSRGYNQKYGVVFRSGVRGITMTNVQTGAPSDSHRNLTDGIVFLNPSDLTNAANFVTACLSNGARMSSV
jgi:hypothetical protein